MCPVLVAVEASSVRCLGFQMSGITRTITSWMRRALGKPAPSDPAANDASASEPRADESPSELSASDPEIPPVPLASELLWLLDAPMFIDEKQVDAFYDAVVRPDYEGTSLTLSDTITRNSTFGGGVTVGAALPWFAKAELEGHGELAHGRERGQQRTLTPVSNTYRHLLALALHYAGSDALRNRLLLASTDPKTAKCHTGASEDELGLEVWRDETYVTDLPRALVFLDLAEPRFIPTALELDNGTIVLLFQAFAEALAKAGDGDAVPPYPGSEAPPEKRDAYWRWFSNKFDDPAIDADRKALATVENAVKEHKVAWIDYRVPLGPNEAPFFHVHIQAHGQFDTGVFAYNLISRGVGCKNSIVTLRRRCRTRG
jgi:hypothetical protein